ncbi:MAG: 2-oxoglutarate oxidoreductase [Desulfitibacter sp. BRH_c19]|nr:MAG: 2-oxoglutarate oxidoreductase [Desulfitibacter sp. BRH_c19]
MANEFKKSKALTDKKFHYCPGCSHGVIHRLVAEVIEELDVIDRTVGIASVGCSVTAYDYFNVDVVQAAHGRAPAVGTGVKRVHPNNVVFTYQGDGDLAAIGMSEIVHAAIRGEKLTTIFVNNTTYGMTGGQMAPTTLIGQKATTAPSGREVKDYGYPVKMSELLSTIEGAAYISRVSVHTPAHVNKAKKAIKKAFETQMRGEGFSLVEILSTCPTNWGMTPVDSLKWVNDNMIPYYPLGEFKTPAEVI